MDKVERAKNRPNKTYTVCLLRDGVKIEKITDMDDVTRNFFISTFKTMDLDNIIHISVNIGGISKVLFVNDNSVVDMNEAQGLYILMKFTVEDIETNDKINKVIKDYVFN